jgi:hypothetical protein
MHRRVAPRRSQRGRVGTPSLTPLVRTSGGFGPRRSGASRPQPTRNCFRPYTPPGIEGQAGLQRSARRLRCQPEPVPPTFEPAQLSPHTGAVEKSKTVEPAMDPRGTDLISRTPVVGVPLCSGLLNRCLPRALERHQRRSAPTSLGSPTTAISGLFASHPHGTASLMLLNSSFR